MNPASDPTNPNGGILLTIGIPTRNGSSHIKEVAESTLAQISGNNLRNVELLVSDNQSTDDTASIIAEVAKQQTTTPLSYYLNESDVGFDKNVDLVVQRASGKYVWLLADDDQIINDGIAKVIDVIRDQSPALVFANFRNSISLECVGTVLCKDGNDYFERTKFKSGLVSSVIVNKQLWIDAQLAQYHGCAWIHFAYAVKVLAPIHHRSAVVIADEIIKPCEGQMRWGGKGSFLVIGLMLVLLFRRMQMEALGYSRCVRICGDYVIKGGYPGAILAAKAAGFRLDRAKLGMFVTCFGRYPSFWMRDLPLLLLIPNGAARSWYYARQAVVEKEKGGWMGLGRKIGNKALVHPLFGRVAKLHKTYGPARQRPL